MTDRDSGPREDDELVNFFPIAIQPDDISPGRRITSPQRFNGLLPFSSILLSFQVECQPGFIGTDCRPAVPDSAPETTTILPPPATSTATDDGGISESPEESPTENTSRGSPILITAGQGPTYGGPTGGGTPSRNGSTNRDSNPSNGFVGLVSGAVVGGGVIVLVSTAVCLGLLVFFRKRKKKVALSDDIPTVNDMAYASNSKPKLKMARYIHQLFLKVEM